MTRAHAARGLFAAFGGLSLFLADYPASQSWLLLFAFVPLLWTVLGARSWIEAGAYGLLWGLGRTVPLAFMLHSFALPLLARPVVESYLLSLDVLFALIAFELRGVRLWPLGVAVTFASIEYADSLLPMWGTARSLARLLATRPAWCGLVVLGGAPAFALPWCCSKRLWCSAFGIGGARRSFW